MSKYRNKYRIASARRPGWDYRTPGGYFITICTGDREHFFGHCTGGRMTLSATGAMLQGFWYEIPKHFDHLQLGEFVVMPNHIHGILLLSEMDGWDDADPTTPVETPHCDVSTGVVEQDKRNTPDFYKKITPQSGSVSTIIGSFKSVCTKNIRKSFPDLNFKWQERFHDHIIRDESSFHRISNYIINNPATWQEDKFFRPS